MTSQKPSQDPINASPLDCESFENRVHQLLDQRGSLTNDQQLMAHASHCAPCDEMLTDYRSVDDSVKLLKEDITAILAQAGKKQAGQSSFSFSARPINILVALSAMLIFGIGVFHLFSAPQSSSPSFLASNVPSQLPENVEFVSSSRTELAMAGPPSSPENLNMNTPAILGDSEITQVATSTQKTKLNDLIIRTANFRIVPDAISIDSNFALTTPLSVPKTFQRFPSVPTVPTWQQISSQLDPFEPVLIRSSGLPGFGPVSFSFNTTINLLRQSFFKGDPGSQDLGFAIDPSILAAA
ncbi:MAG: hypothetical protein AB8B55_24050 [Mariniblastus sp.]